jgi:hypothetical protein
MNPMKFQARSDRWQSSSPLSCWNRCGRRTDGNAQQLAGTQRQQLQSSADTLKLNVVQI